MNNPKYRRPLNKSQYEILLILYKFRFATVELISQYQELKSPAYTYKRLSNLVEQEYIGRNYDGNYKIHGREATYFLLKKGIRTLLKDQDLNQKSLKGMYRDSTVSNKFIEHCIRLFRIYNKLIETYSNKIEFYSKSEMNGELDVTKQPFDGFITLTINKQTKNFLLELLTADQPLFTFQQRIRKLMRDYENGNSEDIKVLLICETIGIEKYINKQILRINNKNYTELEFYTTTLKDIDNISSESREVWSTPNDNNPISLDEI